MKPVHPNEIAAAKGRALANDILAGQLPPADYPLWTDSEWRIAAEMAIDTDDYSELLWMLDEEREADREEAAARDLEYRLERNRNAVIDRAVLRGVL